MDDARTLVTSRDMGVTVDRAWDAWTDPARIARWWCPTGFTSTVGELDVRAGGRPGGGHARTRQHRLPVHVFDHVEPRRQLTYTNTGSGEFARRAVPVGWSTSRKSDARRADGTIRLGGAPSPSHR
ncbi:MAG: SRPBCC domain-containing protein [Dehalococcoidia bacterium]